MRSGVIHIGYGTIISSETERQADREGKVVGHFHVHLYYPTYVAEGTPEGDVLVIEDGRLKALDDPEVREVAAKYGDPDDLLQEDWIPAIPGLNMAGDYEDYAKDPLDWTLTELHMCRNWHPVFMAMTGATSSGSGGHACH
jgi:hypothetical protein